MSLESIYTFLVILLAVLWVAILGFIGTIPQRREFKHPTIKGVNILRDWCIGFLMLFFIQYIADALGYHAFAFVFIPIILVFLMMFFVELSAGEIITYGESEL